MRIPQYIERNQHLVKLQQVLAYMPKLRIPQFLERYTHFIK